MAVKRRIINWLIALDQFLWCSVTLGHVEPDMTLSASAWIAERKGKLWGRIVRPTIDFLFRIIGQADHCRKAAEAERTRVQIAEELV